MNILFRQNFMLYSLGIGTLILCNGYTGFGQRTDSLNNKSSSRQVSTNQNPVTRTKSSSNSRESEMAKSLADKLKNAGMDISNDDLKQIADGMARGGQGAMAIAFYIMTEITEAAGDEAVKNSSAPKTRVVMSEKKIDEIIVYLAKEKDSSPELSQYLKSKFTRLKKTRQSEDPDSKNN